MIIQRFAKNIKGRDFVVGDLHGMFGMLADKLNEVAFDGITDRLFSVGDLVDRGPDSEESIHWLDTSWFHAVRGNHEQMAIGVAAGKHDRMNYMRNGGQWFIDLDDAVQKHFAEVFDAMPYLIEVETDYGAVGIVHAEISGESWNAYVEAFGNTQSNNQRRAFEETCLWAREKIRVGFPMKINDLYKLYVGHTPVHTPTTLGNVCYIDTGAVFGGHLTLVEIQNSKEK